MMQREYLGNPLWWTRQWNWQINGKAERRRHCFRLFHTTNKSFFLSQSSSPPFSSSSWITMLEGLMCPLIANDSFHLRTQSPGQKVWAGKPLEPVLSSLSDQLFWFPEPVQGHVHCSQPLFLFNLCALLIDCSEFSARCSCFLAFS